MSSLKTTSSWVIIDNVTNQTLFETYSKKIALSINQNRYKVVPILEYLQNFNKGVK